MHREQILQQALSLPPEDRACVAAALEASLPAAEPGREKSNAALLTELQRRSSAYRAGTTSARPAAEILAEQRKRQAGEAKTKIKNAHLATTFTSAVVLTLLGSFCARSASARGSTICGGGVPGAAGFAADAMIDLRELATSDQIATTR